MSKGKYGEPWIAEPLQALLRFGRKNSGPWDEESGYMPDDADAARITTCVNALDGIEDPAAELERLREIEQWVRMARERHLIPLANREGEDLLRMDLNDLEYLLDKDGE